MAEMICIAGVIIPTCPKCGRTASTKETQYGLRHKCCGMHSWRGKPLVDQETHDLRREAHALIDPLWQSGRMRRSFVYKKLAELMGMSPIDCHVSLMGAEQLRRALKVGVVLADLEDPAKDIKRTRPGLPRCACGNLASVKRIENTGDRRCKTCIRVEEALAQPAGSAKQSKGRAASDN